jgi:hypothetical protein
MTPSEQAAETPKKLTFREMVLLKQANQHLITQEVLLPFAGQWIAISADYTRILAGGKDGLELDEKLRAAGFDPEQVWRKYVPSPDDDFDHFLGGIELEYE